MATKLKCDEDERLLCPECGRGLYFQVAVVWSRVIPYWDFEYNDLDTYDAEEGEFVSSDPTSLYCDCGFVMKRLYQRRFVVEEDPNA